MWKTIFIYSVILFVIFLFEAYAPYHNSFSVILRAKTQDSGELKIYYGHDNNFNESQTSNVIIKKSDVFLDYEFFIPNSMSINSLRIDLEDSISELYLSQVVFSRGYDTFSMSNKFIPYYFKAISSIELTSLGNDGVVRLRAINPREDPYIINRFSSIPLIYIIYMKGSWKPLLSISLAAIILHFIFQKYKYFKF